jgi:hypothetical protein
LTTPSNFITIEKNNVHMPSIYLDGFRPQTAKTIPAQEIAGKRKSHFPVPSRKRPMDERFRINQIGAESNER